MKNIIAACCLFVIISCDNEPISSNQPPATKDSDISRSEKPPAPVMGGFAILDFNKDYTPLKDSIKGKIVDGTSWKDAEGENTVILSETENLIKKDGTQNKQLYAYCFMKDGDDWKRKWLVQDKIEACEVDATCNFFPQSLSITDNDKNNIGEATFLYELSCKGDVSPNEKKLIMYEGAHKYAIRGTTIIQVAGSKEGGEKKVDASFSSAAKPLLDYANGQWYKFGLTKY